MSGNVIDFPTEGRGDFFAVDQHAWARACTLGINAMVSYIVLARGTGRDQRTTTWSVNAIEDRTGISRPRAKEAIAKLAKDNLLQVIRVGARPRYRLVPASDVPGGAIKASAQTESEWTWLPNSLVDGAHGETPPVELARQTQNPAVLRLLIDLYYWHDLHAFGGIDWRHIRQSFQRHRVGQRGPFVVYGFDPSHTRPSPDAPFLNPQAPAELGNTEQGPGWDVFFDAWDILDELGLVEMVGHLIDGDGRDASMIHPYAVGNGEAAERQLGEAAHDAGLAMLPRRSAEDAEARGLRLAPVRRHQAGAQMVGVARLKYRPRTSATAAWQAQMDDWSLLAGEFAKRATEARGFVSEPVVQLQRASR